MQVAENADESCRECFDASDSHGGIFISIVLRTYGNQENCTEPVFCGTQIHATRGKGGAGCNPRGFIP
jgi:hypothetical protein